MSSFDPADVDFSPEALLHRIREAVTECRERHGVPEQGSSCADEFEAEMAVAGDGWNADPIRLAFSEAISLLIATQDQQHSTVVVLGAPSVGWGVPVVARATLETAARGAWLTDPKSTLLERAARAWNLKLSSWWWMSKDEGRASDWWLLVGRRTMELLAGAQSRGLAFGLPGRGNAESAAPFIGERMPGYAALVEEMLPGLGRDIYRSLSGFSHGGLHALDDGAQFGEPNSDGVREGRMGLSYPKQIVYGVAATFSMLVFVEQFFAWAGWRDDEWIEEIQVLGAHMADLFDAAVDSSS